MGRFDESWQWYRQAYKTSKAGSRIAIDSLVGGAVSAAHAGREDIVRQILRDRRPLLDQHHATGLLEGYLDVLAGRKMNYKAVWSRPENDIQWWLDDRLQTLTMQADILEGQPGHWKWAEDNLSICMHRREYAVLLHAFYQKHPRLASDCFYRAMEWLYPDDAWVRQAVAEYRDGGAKGEVIPPAKVLEKLKDYPPVRRATGAPARSSASWQLIKDLRAGAVAAAVRESLAAGKLDQAEELALRYYNLCASAVNYRPRAHAGHLVYLVEQARKAMKSALGPNDL
jgi:hypothetical protein